MWSQAITSLLGRLPAQRLGARVDPVLQHFTQYTSVLLVQQCTAAVKRLSAGVSWLASVEDGHSKRAREPAQLTFSFDMQSQGAVQQQEQAALTVGTLDAATLLREALGGHPGGPYLTAALYRPTVQVSCAGCAPKLGLLCSHTAAQTLLPALSVCLWPYLLFTERGFGTRLCTLWCAGADGCNRTQTDQAQLLLLSWPQPSAWRGCCGAHTHSCPCVTMMSSSLAMPAWTPWQ